MKPNRNRRGLIAWGLGVPLLGAVVWAGGCGATYPVPDMSARFYSVHAAMQASGLSQLGSVSRGRLQAAQSVKLPLELTSECLTVVALGDRGVADLSLSLRDGDGKELAADDMIGPDASLRYCPDQPGKHQLVVQMAEGTGGYAVSTWTGGSPMRRAEGSTEGPATVEGGGTCDAPTVIAAGQTYVGDTGQGHQMEEGTCGNTAANELVYRLDLPSRQRVTIDVRAQYDAVLYVRHGDCTDPDTEVACNDDAPGGGRRSRVDEVLEPGTYFLFVDGYGEEEGAFRMTVQTRPAPSARSECDTAPVVALGGSVRGALANRVSNAKTSCGNEGKGPDRPFRFDLASRTRVRITQRARGFAPVVHVRTACDDAETEVGCSNEGVGSGEASFVGMLEAGSYFLFADASAETSTGDFVLSTQSAPESGGGARGDTCGEAISLASEVGVAQGDTFDARDDVVTGCGGQGTSDVLFRVDLIRRARLSARIRKQEGKHKLSLQRACGVPGAEIACGTSIDNVLPPGTYWVVVQDSARGTFGRFQLGYRIQDVSAAEAACKTASPVSAARPVAATLAGSPSRFTASCAGPFDSQVGPDRVHQFTLTKRANVDLSLLSTSFRGVMTLRKDCLGASNEVGCRVSSGGTSPLRLQKSLEPGTYYVVVAGRDRDSSGEYTLRMKVEDA